MPDYWFVKDSDSKFHSIDEWCKDINEARLELIRLDSRKFRNGDEWEINMIPADIEEGDPIPWLGTLSKEQDRFYWVSAGKKKKSLVSPTTGRLVKEKIAPKTKVSSAPRVRKSRSPRRTRTTGIRGTLGRRLRDVIPSDLPHITQEIRFRADNRCQGAHR